TTANLAVGATFMAPVLRDMATPAPGTETDLGEGTGLSPSASAAGVEAEAEASAINGASTDGLKPAPTPVPTLIDTTIQIGRSHQSRLIGRDAELLAIHSMVQEIEQRARLQVGNQRRITGLPLDTQRRSQCLLLMGEAGLGKTRLAEEASREAQRRGWSVAWGRVYQQ